MKRGAFETGTYRNVFAEAGYDKETIEKRKNEIFHTLFYGAESERIYHPVGDDMAYIEDTGNHDARTEGMSYGMMMCVQMDRKEEFDRLWKWAKTHMQHKSGEFKGDVEGIFNYSREAKELLHTCIHKGENGEGGRAMRGA